MVVERPEHNKLTGFYFGRVLWHLPHGQLKVFVYGVYPEELRKNPSALPTAMQITPLFGGNSRGDGCFSYPNIGATVVCTFINGDQNMPVVIGALQGGENAYAQYNYVKHIGQISCDRHMITTGNTHVRLHDDGQFNVLTRQPWDNKAEIDWEKVDGVAENLIGISSDLPSVERLGISEPIRKDIDSHKLSCVECRFSVNDTYGHGLISAGEHFFDRDSATSAWQPISGESTAVSGFSNVCTYDLSSGMLNNELIYDSMSSINEYQSSFNSVDFNTKAVCKIDYSRSISKAANNVNALDEYAGIQNLVDQISSIDHVDTTAGIDKHQQFRKTSGVFCKMSVDVQNEFSISSYMESFNRNGDVRYREQLDTDSVINMPNGGSSISAKYNNVKEVNDAVAVTNTAYWNRAELSAGPNFEIMLSGMRKIYSSVHYDVLCRETMNVKDGYMELTIHNRSNGNDCVLQMGADGVAGLSSTNELRLHSGKIKIDAQAIDVNGSAVNIVGGNGDCKIGAVSLLNHVHREMQSGHIVAPGPTATAVASN